MRRSILLLLVVGALAVLVTNEQLRNRLLDVLFGAEEEFEYTSITEPAPPATSGVS